MKDLPPEILEQWKKLNLTPEMFLKPIGLSIPAGEKGRLLIEQASSRPTCDVNGIWGGYIGEGSKTVIPSHASAKVSFRLVEGQDPQKIRKAFRDYVTARIPGDCKVEFGDHSAAPAVALDWNMKPLAAASKALTEEWGKETVLMGSGASIPIVADFKRDAWAGLAARRLRPGRRQHPLAEREVRPAQLPEGHPLLGADPRGAGGGEIGRGAVGWAKASTIFAIAKSGHASAIALRATADKRFADPTSTLLVIASVAKQSKSLHGHSLDCFVAALLAMTAGQIKTPPGIGRRFIPKCVEGVDAYPTPKSRKSQDR